MPSGVKIINYQHHTNITWNSRITEHDLLELKDHKWITYLTYPDLISFTKRLCKLCDKNTFFPLKNYNYILLTGFAYYILEKTCLPYELCSFLFCFPLFLSTSTSHFLLTLLYKGAIHKPHGIVQCSWGHRSHGKSGWVEPVEQVH